MPLVVPGVNSEMGDKSEWVSKLLGKKIGDTPNETVCYSNLKVLIGNVFNEYLVDRCLRRRTFPSPTVSLSMTLW